MLGGAGALPGFEETRQGRLQLVLRASERTWLLPLLIASASDLSPYRPEVIPHGRGGTVALRIQGRDIVVRPGRRGGWAAAFLTATYFGLSPRVVSELAILEHLVAHQIAVPRPLGAAVEWRFPGCYRSWLATERLAAARPLSEWLSIESNTAQRLAVAERLGGIVRRVHEAGIHHPDLNLSNILVVGTMGKVDVALIDFDRARREAPASDAEESLVARLQRSAHRLNLSSTVDAEFLRAVREGYRHGRQHT